MLKQASLMGLLFLADKAIYFYRLKIPLRHLQKEVEKQFPLEKQKYFFAVSLVNPVVKLNAAENKIGIEITVRVNAPGNFTAQWHGLIEGCLHYDRQQGAFYLSQLRFHADRDKGELNKYSTYVLALVGTILDNIFAVTPVFKLHEDSLKHALARLLFKTITVAKDSLVIRFSLY